jgi:hypothetical protein
MNTASSSHVVRLADLSAVRCPCGWARRAFAELPGAPASMHLVEIDLDARTHYRL